QIGIPVSISVSVSNGGTEFAGAWIDLNQDGTFSAGEFITLTDADGLAPWVFDGSINLPLNATLGTTVLRVRSSYFTAVDPGSACSNDYSYGETEDYLFEVLPPPTPANATASIIDDCNNNAFTIDVNIADFG
ncbi:MAG TPA: GEVED domain-containing protein, partial [Flavobacteriales bacterium]|nr:GEVED domain-containing protein [Flavobacteriales bacterium]